MYCTKTTSTIPFYYNTIHYCQIGHVHAHYFEAPICVRTGYVSASADVQCTYYITESIQFSHKIDAIKCPSHVSRQRSHFHGFIQIVIYIIKKQQQKSQNTMQFKIFFLF